MNLNAENAGTQERKIISRLDKRELPAKYAKKKERVLPAKYAKGREKEGTVWPVNNANRRESKQNLIRVH